MGENSKIEWTTHTANFWIGCTEVSAECDNCYARTLAVRYGWAKWGNEHPRHKTKLTQGKLNAWDKKAGLAGERHRVFVNSLSDTCDAKVPQDWRDEIVTSAVSTPNLDYLILTKRPQSLCEMFPMVTGNMWFGTTVGVKKSLRRIDHLRSMDYASIRFLSIEPLLEDLGEIDLTGIDWVIVGGESGTGKRPFNADWARSIRDQCKAQQVPFFMKQMDKIQPIPEDLMIREFPYER